MHILAVLLSVTLCACAGHIADMDGAHIQSDLSVMDFNRVASKKNLGQALIGKCLTR